MGKYAESIGVWKHSIGGITHHIKPVENDNIEFVRVKKEASKHNDETILVKGIGNLYYDMVLRSDPLLSDIDKKELKDWISLNINQIIEDLMIAFKWTTREKLDRIEEKMEQEAVNSQKKKMRQNEES